MFLFPSNWIFLNISTEPDFMSLSKRENRLSEKKTMAGNLNDGSNIVVDERWLERKVCHWIANVFFQLSCSSKSSELTLLFLRLNQCLLHRKRCFPLPISNHLQVFLSLCFFSLSDCGCGRLNPIYRPIAFVIFGLFFWANNFILSIGLFINLPKLCSLSQIIFGDFRSE